MREQTSGEPLLLGGGSFYGIPFPLVVDDLYIHLRIDDGDPICQIWRWDAEAGRAIRQPDPGDSGRDGIRLQAAGAGGLELTLQRAGSGPLAGVAERGPVRVVLTPSRMDVWLGASDTPTVSFQGVNITGSDVGVRVSGDGVSVGSRLPDGFDYQLDYVRRWIHLGRMVTAEKPLLSHVRFVDCRIDGPIVMVARTDDVIIQDGNWNLMEAPMQAAFVDLPVPGAPYGMLQLEHVTFEGCDLVNVAVGRVPTE